MKTTVNQGNRDLPFFVVLEPFYLQHTLVCTSDYMYTFNMHFSNEMHSTAKQKMFCLMNALFVLWVLWICSPVQVNTVSWVHRERNLQHAKWSEPTRGQHFPLLTTIYVLSAVVHHLLLLQNHYIARMVAVRYMKFKRFSIIWQFIWGAINLTDRYFEGFWF